ncbi:MAG TPA: ceramidase domain-containing protein [Longimicrobiales bacterium]|nr:ceramidase domain-containing protein [Longimicrobiales bacterium]
MSVRFAELAASAAPWSGLRPATCYPDSCFCEALRDGLIRQPVNAASSLAFVVVAVAVARSSAGEHPSGYERAGAGVMRDMFVLSLVLIGVGSAFYHSSLSFAGQFADVLGMYLLATLVILAGLKRFEGLSARNAWVLYGLANGVLAWALYGIPELRRYLFGALIVLGAWLEARRREWSRSDRTLRVALGVFALALVAWTLDITGAACRADSWVQGHALWHVLTATTCWLLYRHYRSTAARERGGPAPSAISRDFRSRSRDG